MKTLFRSTVITLLITVAGVASAAAQSVDCATLFRAAVQAAADHCAGLERNQACLASGAAMLEVMPGYDGAALAHPGDIVDAAAIDSLVTSSADAYALVVMRLQFNQPDAVPEHNSVLLLLGDVQLQSEDVEVASYEADNLNALSNEEHEIFAEDGIPSPLQAFSFVSDATHPCSAELLHGVLVQSPNLTPADEGYLPTRLWVNGWSLALGSTVLVNAESGAGTAIEVLEHYASVGGQDGEVVVLVGQGVDLPAGTPFVSNEDGTVVVVPRPVAEADRDSSFFEELLDALFAEEEVVNRPRPLNRRSGTVEPELTERNDQVVADGIWKFEVNGEVTRGDCMFNIWDGQIGISQYITLNEVVKLDSNAHPVAISLMGMDYSFSSQSGIMLGGGSALRGDKGRYEAFATPLGDTILEWVRLDVITPFYMQGRFLGHVQDQYAARGCTHVFTFELSSCLQDLFYDETDGSGVCPVEIHDAMGTR